MIVFLEIIIAFFTLLILAYVKAPLWAWSLLLLLSILSWQITFTLPFTALLLLGVLFGFVFLLNIPKLRQKLILHCGYKRLKQMMPPMSRTEQEAIDAGDVFWEGELFRGRPNWEHLLALPRPSLTDEELTFLTSEVETLCTLLDDWKITHVDLDMSEKAWKFLKEKGFFGMVIPKEYGGLGFSALATSTIVQKIATRSLTAAVSTMVPNSLGPAELLLAYGDEEQKKYYLPKLARGEEIPCFALTSVEAGSDASAVPDFGIVTKGIYEGKEVLGLRLTWNKRYITLAPVATVLGLAFHLYDPDKLLGDKTDLGITLCLIPTKHEGVEIGLRHFPLNQSFMNGPTRGNQVFIPMDWVIGGVKNAGKGWHMLVECLSIGRGISLPALSTAAIKMCYRTTGAYAHVRKQFNLSIGRFEGVEEALARIGGYTYILEATRLLTLTAIMQKKRPAIASAIAKYHMTELSRRAANDAMDVHGGKGIMLGPKNYLGRCYESMPISITVEGANILTRSLIIFGQGLIRCHPFLREEMNALKHSSDKTGVAMFDKAFSGHLQYALSNFAGIILHSLSFGVFLRIPKIIEIKYYTKKLTRMSLAFSFIIEVALLCMGEKLKRKERISARLGDILSYLYCASAVIKYYHDFGNKEEDLIYVKWALQFCLYRIQAAFRGFFRNFPFPILSFFARFLVFPFGASVTKPPDIFDHQLAVNMMQPTKFRERLSAYCYIGNTQNSALAILEEALTLSVAAEPLLHKLDLGCKNGILLKEMAMETKIDLALKAQILTLDEVHLLQKYEQAKVQAIQVDEFTEEELVRK